jgi:acyl-CoA reductase-like NAD-dependent aldehyde dehydrogenase
MRMNVNGKMRVYCTSLRHESHFYLRFLLLYNKVEAFKALPKGTIHFISGGGRATMPPIMASGAVDGLAFIGGSNAADDLIKQHPHPHRLKVFLQLEANNMAVSQMQSNSYSAEYDGSSVQAIFGSSEVSHQLCSFRSFCKTFSQTKMAMRWKML